MTDDKKQILEVGLEIQSEPIYVIDKTKYDKGSFEYRNLFYPQWELFKHYSTFTPEQTVFLSLDLNEKHTKALIKKTEEGKCTDSTIFLVFLLNQNFPIRMNEIVANMSIFGEPDGRINREKYYNWAKARGKQIPDEFAPIPDELANRPILNTIKKIKPTDDESLKKRILEELYEVGVLSPEDKIPRDMKAKISNMIFDDCDKYDRIKNTRQIKEKIRRMGFISEVDTRK